MGHVKTLILATAAAEMLMNDAVHPERNRPLIDRNTGTVWWLIDRQSNSIVARDVGGFIVTFDAADMIEPSFVPAMPPVILSSGKLIESVRHPSGYQIAIGAMSDNEWKEFGNLLSEWAHR